MGHWLPCLLIVGVSVAACSSGDTAGPPPPPPTPDAAPAHFTASCSIPTGPFGFKRGDTVDPSFSFQAYVPGLDLNIRTYTMGDLFDCDGSRGINAIYIEESEQGCGPCENEETDIGPLVKSSWGALGVAVIVLMQADNKQQPATMPIASIIRSTFGLDDVIVGIEPKWVFAESPDFWAYPTNAVIDPRTLRVLDKSVGYGNLGSLAKDGSVLWLLSANR